MLSIVLMQEESGCSGAGIYVKMHGRLGDLRGGCGACIALSLSEIIDGEEGCHWTDLG